VAVHPHCIRLGIVAAVCLAAALLLMPGPDAPDPPDATIGHETPPPPAVVASEPLPARIPAHDARAADPAPRSFDEYLAELVELGVALWRAAEAGDRDAADVLDGKARRVLTELHNRIPAAGEPALARLCAMSGSAETIPTVVRRRLCTRIVQDELDGRWQRHTRGGSRAPTDQLVATMLDSIPLDAKLADELGAGMLVDRPFLGEFHEPAVLRLVDLVPERPELRAVATALLLTLWRNLGESGSRNATNLSSLALLFKDDANPSRRLAALRHLLVAEDGRYREVVLDHVLASKDASLAQEVAQTAATTLPPAVAIRILERLADTGGPRLLASFMMLGRRDAKVLVDAYERHLADGVAPTLRAELVTGAGFDGGPGHVELARLAFEQDPSLDVRSRAMFVLTAKLDLDAAELVLGAALDDPRGAEDPTWIGAIALACRNLADRGEVNGLARVAQRLLTHPRLRPADKRQLEQLVAEHTPGRCR
jgi:hypothetical protein